MFRSIEPSCGAGGFEARQGPSGPEARPQYAGEVASPASPSLSGSQLETLARVGEERTAEVGEVLYARRRSPLSVHSDHRGRGGHPGGERARDRPARRLWVPGRDEPPDGPDGLPDGGRDATHALHRGRPGRPPLPSVRRRPALRAPAVDVHGPPRGAAAASRGLDSRSSARAHRRRLGGSSSTPGAAVSRTPGATPSTRTTPRPRRSSARSTPASSRWCGCRAGRSCAIRPTARCLARSGSASTSMPMRRSTSSSSAAGRPGWELRSTERQRALTRSWSRAPCSAVRRGPPGASRTTSASRPASPAPSSRAAR